MRNVRLWLLIVLIAMPLIELALLIKLGQVIGFWSTIGIVVLTALAGSMLLHRQGLKALSNVMSDVNAGRPPLSSMLDGVLVMAAGLFLLTPGLITDTIGLLLLVPSVRVQLRRYLMERVLAGGVAQASASTRTRRWRRHPDPRSGEGNEERPRQPHGDPRDPPSDGEGIVIEGEFERLDERTVRPPKQP